MVLASSQENKSPQGRALLHAGSGVEPGPRQSLRAGGGSTLALDWHRQGVVLAFNGCWGAQRPGR